MKFSRYGLRICKMVRKICDDYKQGLAVHNQAMEDLLLQLNK